MHESRRHSLAKSVHLVPTRVQKIALRDNCFEHALLLCLQRGVGNIVKAFANPALKAEEQGVLEAIVAQCDFLDSRWNQVNALCQGMPPTFVHGDLKAKNIRVRHTSHGIAVLPFDWEIAGWGVPAVDLLKCPDLAICWAEAQGHWPDLKLRELERLAEVGELFRALIAIYWKSLALIYEWVEWPVEKLRLYRAKLAECIQSLGLE